MNLSYLIVKALISGASIVAISEIAKKNNLLATLVHSLPLMSITAFIWLYLETKDAVLIGNHAYGTFWFVLPTLPMFYLMPWLIKTLGGFWPGLLAGIVLSVILYVVTMHLLKVMGVNF